MYISEHLNLHDYIWELNDVTYILVDATTIRSGIILGIDGTTYTILMEDTSENEVFNNPRLFPLHSNAAIYAEAFLITPTPSVSISASPSPSRTPLATSTPTPTPTPSFSNPPNLLKDITWTASHGVATGDSEGNYSFSSTSDGTTSVKFTTTLTVAADKSYTFSTRYVENTVNYASIQFKTSGGTVLNSNKLSGSGEFVNTINVPTGTTSVIVTIQLFADSNYTSPAPANYVYKLKNLTLVQENYTPSGQSYDSVILAKTPIAYWPLNTNLDDAVSSNNLTLEANAQLLPDDYGNVLLLANSVGASYGALLDTPISLTNNYSLEAWVYIETLNTGNGYSTIIGVNDPDDATYGLQYDNGGGLALYGNNDNVRLQGFTLTPNTQYHIIMTVDDSGNVIFYINGNTYDGDNPSVDTYLYQFIGNDQDDEYLAGVIGNPAIYNYALTAEQVMENYLAGTLNYRYNPSLITPTPTISITPTLTPTPTPSPITLPKFLLRLNSDGSIDNSFVNLNNDFGLAEVVQISGNKIYVGGNFTTIGGETYNKLARLNSDGTLDTTFTGLDLGNPVESIKQTLDTNIYVGGGFTLTTPRCRGLMRLNSSGVLDTSYVNDLGFIDGSTGAVSIIQTADSKIYVGGDITFNGYKNLIRLNSDGTLDTSFTDLALTNLVSCVYEAVDGKIYVAGQFQGVSSYDYLLRLNSDGTLDETFVNVGASATVNVVIQTSDSKIYVGGYGGIIRLNSDGTVDNTYTPISSSDSSTTSLYQTIDGNIYVGNGFSNYARLTSSGVIDTAYNAPSISGYAKTYQTADDKIYVAYAHN